MKKIIDSIKEGAKKVVDAKEHSRKIANTGKSVIGNKDHFAKPKAFKSVLVALIIIMGFLSFVFGISVYAAKSEDPVTTLFARILQLPAIYTSSGTISVGEFLHNKNYVIHFYNATDQGELDEVALVEQIREQLIENEIIINAVNKYKIDLTAVEKTAAIDKIVNENGGSEEVEKVLDELYGLNLKQFEKLVSTQLLREKINNELIQRAKVKHILIRVAEDATAEQAAEAKAKIDGIKAEIVAGKTFVDAAKEQSEDVGSNELGGDLDPFSRGEMVTEFEEAAFSGTIGEIADPIRTSFGWHIIFVEERNGEIENSFDGWLAELREDMIILKLY